MPILNGLSKKLSEVAQTTVQVSKELAGSAKATLAISAEERDELRLLLDEMEV